MHAVGGMQWPFSAKVFLPSQYNMPTKSASEENEQRNSVRASTLWPISNGSTLLDHNDKNLGNNWMKQATLSLGWSSSSIDAKPGGSSISPSTHAFMDGLPKTTSSNFPRNNDKSPQLPASLTIFYSGSVHVYHGVSPETAEAIFSMASKEPSPMTGETKQSSKTVVVASEDIILQPSNAAAYPAEMTSAKFIAGAVTMARKATLARFLQKRKHRLTNARPYNVTSEKKLHINYNELQFTSHAAARRGHWIIE